MTPTTVKCLIPVTLVINDDMVESILFFLAIEPSCHVSNNSRREIFISSLLELPAALFRNLSQLAVFYFYSVIYKKQA